MSTSTLLTRAIAIDLRAASSSSLIAVALVVPSEKYAATRAKGGAATVEPALTDELWSDIDAWATAGDAGLPARPAPLGRRIVDHLFVNTPQSAVAERSASILIHAAPLSEFAPVAQRILSELLATS